MASFPEYLKKGKVWSPAATAARRNQAETLSEAFRGCQSLDVDAR